VALADPTNPQGNTLLLNIRYADTPAQKELKRITAERRQFRTNEYNIGAYGTPHVGLQPHTYGMTSPFRRSYPPMQYVSRVSTVTGFANPDACSNTRSYGGMDGHLRYSGDGSSSGELGPQP
jgi:hypothetical protein